MPKQDAELEEILHKLLGEWGSKPAFESEQIQRAMDKINIWRDKSVNEARIEELSSIDYGCEDSDENEAVLELIMNDAVSTIDGRSLKSRIAHLNKKGEE